MPVLPHATRWKRSLAGTGAPCTASSVAGSEKSSSKSCATPAARQFARGPPRAATHWQGAAG